MSGEFMQLLGEEAIKGVVEGAVKILFGPVGASAAALAVGIAFEIRHESEPKPEPTAAEWKAIRGINWVVRLITCLVFGLIGGAILWANVARSFSTPEHYDQFGGSLMAAIATLLCYFAIPKTWPNWRG